MSIKISFLDLNIKQREIDMKIQAKEVKVGMTIKWGVVTMIVEDIETTYQKNGKELKLFTGNVTRSMGRGHKAIQYHDTIKVKSETFLN